MPGLNFKPARSRSVVSNNAAGGIPAKCPCSNLLPERGWIPVQWAASGRAHSRDRLYALVRRVISDPLVYPVWFGHSFHPLAEAPTDEVSGKARAATAAGWAIRIIVYQVFTFG
jgi:hypothetical protein